MLTLQIELILSPKKEKGQSFRPIQPICLLTESIEIKDDEILKTKMKTLQSKDWSDFEFDFTIAGTTFVYTRTLHNSDWTTNNVAICKFRVEQGLSGHYSHQC